MSRIYSLIVLLAVSLYFSACKTNTSNELSHHHEHSHHDHSHNHNHDHNDNDEDAHTESEEHEDGEITLSPSMAERFGVTTEIVKSAPFADAVKVTGEVLASTSDVAVIVATKSGVINFNNGISLGSKVDKGSFIASVNASDLSGGDQSEAAKARLDAAKREYERIKPLYDERLVTAAEYNNALQVYEEANASYSASASSGRVYSPISGIITSIDVYNGQFIETGTPIATVSSSTNLTLRVDMPQKYNNRINSFNDASVIVPYSGELIILSNIGGKRISPSGIQVSTIPGYIPLYFSMHNDGRLLSGSLVDVFMLSGSLSDVISVPLSALSEQQGQFYVFVRLDDECYKKILVKTGRNNGERIEIISGLSNGDNVVVTGTTTVRIAESSGNIPEGHTHNH